jgi:hypothetical protein
MSCAEAYLLDMHDALTLATSQPQPHLIRPHLRCYPATRATLLHIHPDADARRIYRVRSACLQLALPLIHLLHRPQYRVAAQYSTAAGRLHATSAARDST